MSFWLTQFSRTHGLDTVCDKILSREVVERNNAEVEAHSVIIDVKATACFVRERNFVLVDSLVSEIVGESALEHLQTACHDRHVELLLQTMTRGDPIELIMQSEHPSREGENASVEALSILIVGLVYTREGNEVSAHKPEEAGASLSWASKDSPLMIASYSNRMSPTALFSAVPSSTPGSSLLGEENIDAVFT